MCFEFGGLLPNSLLIKEEIKDENSNIQTWLSKKKVSAVVFSHESVHKCALIGDKHVQCRGFYIIF